MTLLLVVVNQSANFRRYHGDEHRMQQERENTVFCYQESLYQRDQFNQPTEMDVIHGMDQVYSVDLELQSQRHEKVVEIQRLLKEVEDCCSKEQLAKLSQGK